MEQTIPAGTIVKIGGFPFELTEDANAESATKLEDAIKKTRAFVRTLESNDEPLDSGR